MGRSIPNKPPPPYTPPSSPLKVLSRTPPPQQQQQQPQPPKPEPEPTPKLIPSAREDVERVVDAIAKEIFAARKATEGVVSKTIKHLSK